MSELVKIQADIRRVPVDSFPRRTGVGNQVFHRSPYEIEMTIRSGSITFALLYRDQRGMRLPKNFCRYFHRLLVLVDRGSEWFWEIEMLEAGWRQLSS